MSTNQAPGPAGSGDLDDEMSEEISQREPQRRYQTPLLPADDPIFSNDLLIGFPLPRTLPAQPSGQAPVRAGGALAVARYLARPGQPGRAGAGVDRAPDAQGLRAQLEAAIERARSGIGAVSRLSQETGALGPFAGRPG
jgi:hypothetical protein